MKSISPELSAHLDGEVTTLAMCWKITRRDNTVLGFTSHDADILHDGVTYEAASGFQPESMESFADLRLDGLGVEGLLDSAAISEADIQAGKYDYAEVEAFLLNYQDSSQGKLILRTGWLGEVKTRGHQYIAEIRGLSDKLNRTIGELYSPSCRANLGDARCKIALAGLTVTGSITSVTSRSVFTDSSRGEAAGYFSNGLITFTSGANNGLSVEIKTHGTGGVLSTVLPLPYDVQVGDGYSLIAGCDKTFSTCKSKFSNVVNFRGEPHVPGLDRMLETSGTRER